MSKKATARKGKPPVARPSVSDKVAKLLKSDAADLAPQAQGIVACLKANKGELTQGQLIEKLGSYIKTRQSAKRIYTFYRAPLVAAKVIKVA